MWFVFDYHRVRMLHSNDHKDQTGLDARRSFGSVDRSIRSSNLGSGLRRWGSEPRRSFGREDRRRFGKRKFRLIRRSWSWGTRRDPLSGERHSSSGRSTVVGHWDRRQADSGARKPPGSGSGRLEDREL